MDGFRLAYDRAGSGPPVVAPARLARLTARLPRTGRPTREARSISSCPTCAASARPTRHDAAPEAYAAAGQAASVLGLIDELALERPILVGYDVGSRVAQTVARQRPDAVRALVISPPLPGVGDRVLTPDAQREFWYQPFHRLALSTELIDGRRDAVASYLRHFWEHWSGPGWSPAPMSSTPWSTITRAPAPSPRASGGTARVPAPSRPR